MADDNALPSVDSELTDDVLFDVSVDADLYEQTVQDAEEGPNPYGVTWAFDFTTGDIYLDHNGAMVQLTEKDVLKQWIGHTLSIARGESSLYSDDIGTDIPYLLGSGISDPDVLNTIKTEVKTALSIHDKIAEINEVSLFPIGDSLHVYVAYVTDDQEEVVDVIGM